MSSLDPPPAAKNRPRIRARLISLQPLRLRNAAMPIAERRCPPQPASCHATMPSPRAFLFNEQTCPAEAVRLHHDTGLLSQLRPQTEQCLRGKLPRIKAGIYLGRLAHPHLPGLARQCAMLTFCGGLRSGIMFGALRKTPPLDFHAVFDSTEYRCLVFARLSRLEPEQQFSAALCTPMLRQKQHAGLCPLRGCPVTEPCRQRHARGVFRRNARPCRARWR